MKWLLPLAAATGTAFAFDRKAVNQISTNPSQVSAFRTASNFTGIYAPVAGLGAAWIAGTITHNDHLRETGLLAGEALADAGLFTEMLKYATNRVRPGATALPNESGEFWPEHFSYPAGDSFPSGHTTLAFAFAHVVADEYPRWEVKVAVYGLAAATAVERLGGREHFPSDVLVGSAAGYLIGGYVYNHHSASAKRRIMVNPLVGGGTVGGSLVFSFSRPDGP
ncbi:MAG: phosphatase PAP2 family protein [Acidobacteriaceae bacterium]|nr:phosphatase PAP2 family protein [Acidobacteriaceae bacterium]